MNEAPPATTTDGDTVGEMENTMRFEIELTRSNVTPAQFLAYVRRYVDMTGGDLLRSDLSLDYFKAGNDLNFNITHEDGTREKSVSRPYEMQTFIRNTNGGCYNEICEFCFDDEKTGHGYYYLLNEEPAEAPVEAAEGAEATETTDSTPESESPAEPASVRVGCWELKKGDTIAIYEH